VKIAPGQTVLLTGASGGLGTHITEALVQLGVKLGLVAYPGTELPSLQQRIREQGGQALALASDLRVPAQRREAVDRISRELGEIDILINGAGVEVTSPYHLLSEEQILEILKVNLEAAMVMTRLVLPAMLKRGRGHIVNISSLAGKAGPALQEPYAATKAGLIAFTAALRGAYRQQGVSASVIIPGFVEVGIYAELKQRSGCSAPALLGTSEPATVIRAMLRAIERDRPEVIVNPVPVRPLLAVAALFPALGEWIIAQTGGHDFFRRVYREMSRPRK